MASIYSQRLFSNGLSGANGTLFTVPTGEVWKVKWCSLWFNYPPVGLQVVQLLVTGTSAGAAVALFAGIIPAALNPFSNSYEKIVDMQFVNLTLQQSESLVWFASDHVDSFGLTIDGYRFTQ
jgi:hypothetical protein